MIQFLDPSTNPFQVSNISKLQEFYWAKYEDLWDKAKLMSLWMKDNEIEYCLQNKDKEFALKSTKWFELREWVLSTDKYKKLQEFYWFTLQDTQDIKSLEKYWLSNDDIFYITGIDISPKQPVWKKLKK